MADTATPQLTGVQDPLRKARKILNRMSKRRIDPRKIRITETEPRAKGGQGAIVVGTIILPQGFGIWIPRQVGEVYLNLKLAIKRLEWDPTNVQQSAKLFKSFVNEVNIMAALSHPNIARFVGFVEDAQKGDAWIVSYWEENGNLREFLRSGEWDIPERISLIKDVVAGVEYLHTGQPPICHGDLKSLNILVNSSYRAVITDFGSARIKPSLDAMKEGDPSKPVPYPAHGDISHEWASPKIDFDPAILELTLTDSGFSIRWTAPEVLKGGVQDLPSDMWAIGWICWEIVTGRVPFEQLDPQDIIEHVLKGNLPAIQEETELSNARMLCCLMSDCWVEAPTRRITASKFLRDVWWLPSISPSSSSHAPDGTKIRSAELLQKLGDTYKLQGNTVIAESHFNSALEVASRTENHGARAAALEGLGHTYRSHSKFLESEKALEEAHRIRCQINDDLGAANVLAALGETYRAQSNYPKAEKTVKEGLTIFCRIHHEVGAETGAAIAMTSLAEIYQATGAPREAEEILTRMLPVHTGSGNLLGAANALVSLGRARHALSKHEGAERSLRESLEIYSRIGGDMGTANALDALGNLYCVQSRYQEAEHSLREAHEIYSRISDEMGAANALVGLGAVYNAQSRYQEAEKTLRDAGEIYSRLGYLMGSANALFNLGGVYRSQTRYQEALDAFREACEIYSSLYHPLGVGNALHGAGVLYSNQHNEEAIAWFRKAIVMYKFAGLDQRQARTLAAISRLQHDQGNYVEAENSLLEAITIGINPAPNELPADASAVLELLSLSDGGEEVEGEAARIRADMLGRLGYLCLKQAKYVDAEEFYQLSQAMYTSLGDGTSEARELRHLGRLYGIQERHEEATEHFAQARVASAGIGDYDGEVKALDGLMVSCFKQQKWAELHNHCSDALEIYERMCCPLSKICDASVGLSVTHESLYSDYVEVFSNWDF